TLNGGTALVQGISARAEAEQRDFVRTVLLLLALATAMVAAVMLAAPAWVARRAGLSADQDLAIRLLAVTVVLSSAFVFLSAVLNAFGEVSRLAMLQIASPFALALLAYPAALAAPPGLPLMLVLSAALSAVFAWMLLREHRGTLVDWVRSRSRWWS